MKKQHYILIAVLLGIALSVLLMNSGFECRMSQTTFTKGIMTLRYTDHTTGTSNETTTVEVNGQEIEIQLSDYETPAEYEAAVEDAKLKLNYEDH